MPAGTSHPGLAVRPARLPLARYVVAAVTGLLAAALVVQTYRYERNFVTMDFEWKSVALVAAFTVFLASAVCLASRRLYASIALSCTVMVLLTALSLVKYQYIRSSLYTLDFYYYARPTEVLFLYQHYPRLFFAGWITTIAAVVTILLLFLGDETRVPRRRGALVFALAALLLAGAYQWRGQRDKIYHFVGWHHASAAVASLPEAVGVLLQGGLLEGADRGGTINSEPVARLQNAGFGAPQPTIISILHESAFPTDLFPIQCGGRVPGDLFTSSNGNRYELRVETYGGATWLTEYGVMLGISTYYFGDARGFIGYTMEDRVHDSLPLQLRRNGYETVALYPTPKSFVNTGAFYKSIGFDKLLDYYDLKASSELERDRFYYEKAIEQIRAHKASGGKAPLFLSLWTMATHGPYDYATHPGVKPDPETICAKDKSWAEYIRRLLMAEDDLAWFAERLKAEFPDDPFMIVGFGDHQPFLSQEFLGPKPSGSLVPAKNSIGYRTFFRITGINFRPDWSAVPQSIDVPYLGNVTMLAARQPRHGFYNDRDKLMALCQGRYNDCPYQDEILSLHQRMIRSSTIVNR